MNITNIKKNCMGTIDFDAQFKGMMKPQDFIVYPNPTNGILRIQSDTRCGYIDTKSGKVRYGKCKYFAALIVDREDIIDNIADLITAVRGTASPMAGTNGIIYCDNSKAGQI